MRLALFEPDIPQNAGTMLRTVACLGVPVDIIEPCGFLLGDAQLRRAGMDYLSRVALNRHLSWEAFRERQAGDAGRLVLLTTAAQVRYDGFSFRSDDTLMVGRESSGVPESVHAAADARVKVPMTAGNRSLNVAIAAAIVLGEALRQTGGLPGGDR